MSAKKQREIEVNNWKREAIYEARMQGNILGDIQKEKAQKISLFALRSLLRRADRCASMRLNSLGHIRKFVVSNTSRLESVDR